MNDPTVSFGLTLPQRGVLFDVIEVRGLIDLAREADSNPIFSSVWVGDSLFSKPRLDSIGLLGALTSATERVQLGVGCMATFPVRDPLVFAFQWATLDALSQGRMLLAACTGIVKSEGASQEEGRPWDVTDGQRATRMAENIDICRALWSGEQVSFDGRFTSFKDITLAPLPQQRPCPIWIASNPMPNPERPEAVRVPLRRVANQADGWMTVQFYPNGFEFLWGELQELLTEAGKDPAEFPTIAYHNVNINDDRQAAFDETRRFLDLYYGPVFNDTAIESWTAHGSPEICIEELRKLRDAGAKNITLRATSWDQHGQYKRLVEEVLPHV